MKVIILPLIMFICLSCSEDKFGKEKFDDQIVISNRADTTIHKIIVWGGDRPVLKNEKSWIFENVLPGKADTINFNINRDVKIPEGSIYVRVFFNEKDSLPDAGFYFTNWQIVGSDYRHFIVYKDKVVLEKLN
ncbi:hypothetical protein L0657_19200 [Dyadobacter sp. CY345]|uniref:hypothetical protein n=1 Tax=Dyadobacter sp. CY345 TaxID=2909335 RepID=UPI001F310628|nr:hypothetical protein [Dyadobacter sp. CY345]MCF2446094.1 hypothetical protein [Dyadobacter sp. CY345]